MRREQVEKMKDQERKLKNAEHRRAKLYPAPTLPW
jgi:hypothetical protein